MFKFVLNVEEKFVYIDIILAIIMINFLIIIDRILNKDQNIKFNGLYNSQKCSFFEYLFRFLIDQNFG